MKNFRWLLALVAVGLLAGCVAPSKQTSATSDTSSRFKEGAWADLIVDFNSWNYTYLNKPEVSDGPYRREVSTNEISLIVGSRPMSRHLAVVKLSWLLKGDALNQTVAQWKVVLQQLNFERVVFVRPTDNPELSGALILHDSQRPQNVSIPALSPQSENSSMALTAR